MKLGANSATSLSLVLTAVISLIIAVSIPAAHFIFAYQYMVGTINAEMEFSARAVEELVVNNPESWQFEEVRIREILERHLDRTYRENRIVRDLQDHVIAETRGPLARPILRYSQFIYDSGRKVAYLEIERSIAPLVIRIVFVGLFSALLGVIIFLIFRLFPLRMVREAYDKLQENERRFRSLVEATSDWVWEVDHNGVYTYASPKIKNLLGYEPGDVIGKTPFDFMPADEAERVAAIFVKAAESYQSFLGLENVNLHKDGHMIVLETNALPIFDSLGNYLGYRGFDRDITDRKRTEEALYASQLHLSEATDLASIVYWEYDLTDKTFIFNDPFYALYGTTAEREGGYRMTTEEYANRFVHPDDLPLFGQARTQKAARHGSESLPDLEHRIIRRDGEVRYVMVRRRLITDESGNVVKRYGANQDITERKQTEETLRETNRRLEDATARAETANVAKSDFLANMSHEIRTPMNGIIGMAGLLLDTDLNNEQRRYAETVRSSAQSLLALLNDILDFSKIEAGKMELEMLDFDLGALLDDFASVMALRVHEKGLEFICAAAPEVPLYLRGDPGRLREILINLTDNAVKFTGKGEIAVRAGVISETDGEVTLRFSIKDTGIGIPAAKRDVLFQKFTQADTSTTRKYGGTGLGLAISKQLAQLMGGEIGFESKVDQGSEFWFTGRFTRRLEPEQAIASPAELLGVHVLVVDDNAASREVLIAQLRAWGMRSEVTSDGPTALRTLSLAIDRRDPFDMAILDMYMPDMDGMTLGHAIKADRALGNTHLILLSPLLQGVDSERIMEEIGFFACLTKPVRRRELLSCLRSVLTGVPMTQPVLQRRMALKACEETVRILLAEDNVTNQQVALGILNRLGFRAEAVANGAEAVKALETLPYDLVLMDVQMPEMDGLEAARHIRDHKSPVRNHNVPIIAMTAHAMQGDHEECLKAGMNDYLSKPVSPEALAGVLEKWLPEGTMVEIEQVSAKSEGFVPVARVDDQTPIFDKTEMISRFMGDKDLALMLVEGFLVDIPRQIEVLRGYLDAGDVRNAERQVHSIKGASANMSGESLRAAAFEVEKAARSGDIKSAIACMSDVERQFKILKETMEKWITDL